MKQTRGLLSLHLIPGLVDVAIGYMKSRKRNWFSRALMGEYESCMKCPRNSLHIAMVGATASDYPDIVALLIRMDQSYPSSRIYVNADMAQTAIIRGNVDIVKLLDEHYNILRLVGSDIMYLQMATGKLEMTEFLIEQKICDVNTALFYACSHAQMHMFKRMRELGATQCKCNRDLYEHFFVRSESMNPQ